MNNLAIKEREQDFPKDMNNANTENEIFFKSYGDENSATKIIWGHGWGQTHAGFEGLIQSLENLGHHIAIDFPGFGKSAEPDKAWDTLDYAHSITRLIDSQTDQPIVWIGHSFGCRVGLQLAKQYPDKIKALAFIAGAGLKRKRSTLQKIKMTLRVKTFKALKCLTPLTKTFGFDEETLRQIFGSADYKNTSGIIRQIFVKVVSENLEEEARAVQCKTLLIYGENDDETPPEIGERLSKLVNDAELHILPNQDHYTVLSTGRHQVTPLLKNFIEQVKQK